MRFVREILTLVLSAGVSFYVPETALAQRSPQSLVLQDDWSLRTPPQMSKAEISEDLSLLRYALESGYGGQRFVPRAAFDRVIQRLEQLREESPGSPSALCDAIGDALEILPDNHIAIYSNGKRCGTPAGGTRPPSVGNNIGSTSSGPWSLQRVEAGNESVPIVSITRLPQEEDVSWNGYTQAIHQILDEPALLVDLRGNGGGSDARGIELAGVLLGRTPPPFFESIVSRQQPETFVLRLNAAKLVIRRARERGDEVQPYMLEDYDGMRERFEQALRGELPPEDVYVPETDTTRTMNAFTQPILVLVDSGCASSCEGTLLTLRSHPRVYVIGQRTGGYVHFGNTGLVVLPHSQFVIHLPTTFFRVRDGEFYERVGVTPDLEVTDGSDALTVAKAWLAGYFTASKTSADGSER